MIIPKNIYHFSVDDVFDCLIEVSDKKIPLFDQPFFKFLRKLNDQYGVNIGLHLFYQKNIEGRLRTLKDILSLKKELSGIDWLFFGPHALEYETPPYVQSVDEQIDTFNKIYQEIDRFAGKNTFTKYVRLQYYSESFELAAYFKKRGVIALFTTDRVVGSHRMPKSVGKKLYESGVAKYKGMNFIRTQFRVEFFADENLMNNQIIKNFKEALNKYGYIVFYTHEIDMMTDKGKNMARLMFETVQKLNLPSIRIP